MATMIVVVGGHECYCKEGGPGKTTVSANRSSLHRILRFASSGALTSCIGSHWEVGGG